MMILELKKPNGEDPYYSIITAYDRKSHPVQNFIPNMKKAG
ncbi:hypothetical protein O5466_24310 [Escherichia coli]|nr:hypothetical protein [Escherichia coli]